MSKQVYESPEHLYSVFFFWRTNDVFNTLFSTKESTFIQSNLTFSLDCFVGAVLLERKFTYLQFRCTACPFNTYNLLRGKLFLQNLKENPQIDYKKCYECPPGAKCDGDVRSVDNYWGYKHTTTQVTLTFKVHSECRKLKFFKICHVAY